MDNDSQREKHLFEFAEWCGYNWVQVAMGCWVSPYDDTLENVKSTEELYTIFLGEYVQG